MKTLYYLVLLMPVFAGVSHNVYAHENGVKNECLEQKVSAMNNRQKLQKLAINLQKKVQDGYELLKAFLAAHRTYFLRGISAFSGVCFLSYCLFFATSERVVAIRNYFKLRPTLSVNSKSVINNESVNSKSVINNESVMLLKDNSQQFLHTEFFSDIKKVAENFFAWFVNTKCHQESEKIVQTVINNADKVYQEFNFNEYMHDVTKSLQQDESSGICLDSSDEIFYPTYEDLDTAKKFIKENGITFFQCIDSILPCEQTRNDEMNTVCSESVQVSTSSSVSDAMQEGTTETIHETPSNTIEEKSE